MIKKIAWDAFKNTGDVNTFLEFKQIQLIEKQILEQNTTKYENELWSEQTEEQSGNNKNDWDNNIGEQFRRL